MNTSYLALQVGLATAMMVGAIVAGGLLLRQGSIRRRRGLAAASDWTRGSDLRHAIGTEGNAVGVAKLDESALAVKPIDLALHDLNKRVEELHARVDVSGKMLTRLAGPPRRESPSAGEKEHVNSGEKERAATNAKVGELSQQLSTLTNELSTLKRTVETLRKPEARSTAEKPEAKSPTEKLEARSVVEAPIALPSADNQKLAALLRVMTAENLTTPDLRQAPATNSGPPPVCAANPVGLGVSPAQRGNAGPGKPDSELKAQALRLLSNS